MPSTAALAEARTRRLASRAIFCVSTPGADSSRLRHIFLASEPVSAIEFLSYKDDGAEIEDELTWTSS